MKDFRFIIYTVIALLLSAVDFQYAFKAFQKPDKVSRSLGWSASIAGLVTLAYLVSVWTRNPVLVSVFSSLTFIGIDCLLVSLIYYVFLTVGVYGHPVSRNTNMILRLLSVIDAGVMMANIFTGVAVTFGLLDPYGVTYQMKTPYIVHLVFTYTMVVMILIILIYKTAQTPRQYRNQYRYIVYAIGVVVVLNAIFLFQDRGSFFTRIDCSTLCYSIGLYLMYWVAYEYKGNYMLNSLSRMVIDNVAQGIVMFDFTDQFIMSNARSRELLKGVDMNGDTTLKDFREAVGIPGNDGERFSVQCDRDVPLRCDYRRLRDRKGRVLGNIYVFTDISREKDITTGFDYSRGHLRTLSAPGTVAVFDIIGLSGINRIEGRDAGDRAIRELAKQMQHHMPEGTLFLRGAEAHLIAFCPHMTEASIAQNVKRILQSCSRRVAYGLCPLEGAPTEAINKAYRSVGIKKLLNADSSRSQSLASLVRALKEADADTEDHVRRTQRMGALLGQRIGLADLELTQLELLCLLHDIGKVGIPLEILNKPGKLADQEWAVLRTHPDKGYKIAMSSDELKPIADMIRYHHERWDGRGYPAGLKGEAIPVLSRIIAIVDAYDAMVNDRAYRKALTPERAQQEIRENAGTQFDPVLAEEFLRLLSEQPELALGEKVSTEVEERRLGFIDDEGLTGSTVPIAYSRYLLDIEDRIVEVDDSFTEITGYPREEALNGMTQYDLIPMENRGDYMLTVSKQFTHGSMAYLRHEIQRRDGERIQVACYGRRYFDSAARTFKSEIIIFRL